MFQKLAVLIVLVAGCSHTKTMQPEPRIDELDKLTMMQRSLPWQDSHGPCLPCGESCTDDDLAAVGYRDDMPLYLYFCFDISNMGAEELTEYRRHSYPVFYTAMLGPGELAPPRARILFDMDDDGDVDLADWAVAF